MKLTLLAAGDPYEKGAKKFVTLTIGSEATVAVSSNNYFTMSERKIVKTFEEPVAKALFGEKLEVGTVLNGWAIRQRHTFVPDQSLAVEVLKGIKKPQMYSFSANTKKLYLSDGQVFFSKYELVRAGKDDQDELLPNITGVDAPQAMLDGVRPTVEELQAMGIGVNEATIEKFNQPLKDQPVVAERAAAANTIGV